MQSDNAATCVLAEMEEVRWSCPAVSAGLERGEKERKEGGTDDGICLRVEVAKHLR